MRKAPNTRLARGVAIGRRRSPSRSRRSRARPARAIRRPRSPRAWCASGVWSRVAEGRREIEPQQREAPLARDGLRAQRFAAALHAEQQQPARQRAGRSLRASSPNARRRSREPALQLAEPADVGETVAATRGTRARACGAAPGASRARSRAPPRRRGRPLASQALRNTRTASSPVSPSAARTQSSSTLGRRASRSACSRALSRTAPAARLRSAAAARRAPPRARARAAVRSRADQHDRLPCAGRAARAESRRRRSAERLVEHRGARRAARTRRAPRSLRSRARPRRASRRLRPARRDRPRSDQRDAARARTPRGARSSSAQRALLLEALERDQAPARADQQRELVARSRSCAQSMSAVTRTTSSYVVAPSASLRSAASRSVSMPSTRAACAISFASLALVDQLAHAAPDVEHLEHARCARRGPCGGTSTQPSPQRTFSSLAALDRHLDAERVDLVGQSARLRPRSASRSGGSAAARARRAARSRAGSARRRARRAA